MFSKLEDVSWKHDVKSKQCTSISEPKIRELMKISIVRTTLVLSFVIFMRFTILYYTMNTTITK